MGKLTCTVTPRSVLGRRGKIYDVKAFAFGESFQHSAADRREAIAQVERDIEYVRLAEAFVHENGFSMFPHAHRAWCLQFPHGGSYLFAAEDLQSAADHVGESYLEREDIQTFLRDAIRLSAPDFLATRRERSQQRRVSP